VCELIAETSAKDKTASFLYALGWTQHSIGAQNIRTMAMVQLCSATWGWQAAA
jgi:formate dehydrogenase major subunit